ncbi:MAG: hypothetical protein IK136_00625 [Oscillospiraceae bacterium]|nr:hypothetical protein [Oscillospiraceae bacterium]
MRDRTKKCISVLLALVFALLCGCAALPGETPDVGEDPAPAAPAPTPVSAADDIFTLAWEPDDGLSPFSCRTTENETIASLLYESLFTLDNTFSPQPLLCESWSTADGLNWTFTLLPGIKAHDGTTLTADDAVYSLQRARSTKWSTRFRTVSSAAATGELTFTVTLTRANTAFPALLDVPLVKNGEPLENGLPAGTGPYTLDTSGEEPVLRAFAGYRSFASLPADTLYLTHLPRQELTKAFLLREVDLICEDPLSEGSSEIRGGHELRRIATPILQYVGFNTERAAFSDASVRRAFALAVDRADIAENVMAGAATVSPLVLPRALYLYDEAWESGAEGSSRAMSLELLSLGFRDDDADGYLERPLGDGTYADIRVDFIVNEENAYKAAAAAAIADAIRATGIDIELRVLPWDEYTAALEDGAFDMYYAETRLTPDLDLTPVLGTDGALNYGFFSDERSDSLLADYRNAADEGSRARAAGLLCRFVSANAPIVPVLYRDWYVHTQRGAVTGLSPSVSGVFRDVGGWSLNKS